MKQLFETLFKRLSPTMKMGGGYFRPRKCFHTLFLFRFAVTLFLSLLSFFFFFSLSFYRFGVSFSHKLHNHNDSAIKASSVSPLGEIVLCFCCVPTRNSHHQRAWLHTPLSPLQPHFFSTVKPILCCLDHEDVLALSGKIVFPLRLIGIKTHCFPDSAIGFNFLLAAWTSFLRWSPLSSAG